MKSRRLGAGSVIGQGARAAYREVAELEGEPHITRYELVSDTNQNAITSQRAIIAIAHITDLHVTDAQSPARFEYINREWLDPR